MATTFDDGYLKISNIECDKISGAPLAYLRVNNTDLASPVLNDKVQYSFDFRYSGNESSKSSNALFNLEAMMSTGADKVVRIAGDGTVFDSATGAGGLFLSDAAADGGHAQEVHCALTDHPVDGVAGEDGHIELGGHADRCGEETEGQIAPVGPHPAQHPL